MQKVTSQTIHIQPLLLRRESQRMSTTTTLTKTNTITFNFDAKSKSTPRPQSDRSHNTNRHTKIILEEDVYDSSKTIFHYYSDKKPSRGDILEWVASSFVPSSIDKRVEIRVVSSGRTAGGESEMLHEFELGDVEGRFPFRG